MNIFNGVWRGATFARPVDRSPLELAFEDGWAPRNGDAVNPVRSGRKQRQPRFPCAAASPVVFDVQLFSFPKIAVKMSYLVLARKWRPQSFETIRGQEHIVRALKNAITSGRIAHAYLFSGIRGVGKTSAARVLAKALNCEQGPTPEPCGKCGPCVDITAGRSVDVFEIDGASSTGVDDVRRLKEAVQYPPVQSTHRIYIIDEVHMLSTAAFNALLKTLEEPPKHVVFIFATTDPQKIPLTILSRCQQFDFKRLSLKELISLLKEISEAEGIEIDDKSLTAIAGEADGSVRDAQSLFDQVISYSGKKIVYQDLKDVLGVVDRDLMMRIAGAVLNRELKNSVAIRSVLPATCLICLGT